MFPVNQNYFLAFLRNLIEKDKVFLWKKHPPALLWALSKTILQSSNEYFISVLPLGDIPSTKHVRGSNFVHIGVADGTKENQAIIFCVLDNLVKGSAGQAIQKANIILNIEETHSLMSGPIFPWEIEWYRTKKN